MASSEELNAQIEALQSQLSSLQNQLGVNETISHANHGNESNNGNYEQHYFKNNIDEIRYDIGRMESFLADLSQRGGNLMTIAGLISLIPYAFLDDSSFFLKYYVFWIFPFLIVAIFSYIMSSFRKNTYRTIFKNETPSIFSYQEEYIRVQQIWLDTYKNYRESLIWHRISSIATQLFIIDYILNFYTVAIYNNLGNGLLLGGLSAIIGLLLYLYQAVRSRIKKKIDHLECGTGAAPVDI